MSPESLLRQFEVIADAPGGVQRLREMILQLAVRGKLVPQEPGDEPASVLLERIEAEKQRLYAAGEIRKPKKLPPIAADEVPFEVPEGWVWVRIGAAMELINGRAFKPVEWSTTGLRIVRIQNLNDENAPFNYCDFPVKEKFYINDGDLLVSWSGTPGTSFGAFVWRRGPAVLNQHIFRCEIFGKAYDNDFARLAINARLDEMIEQAHGGVGLRHITKGKLEALAIVLPPLPEQRRIVEKVDELMALCDELEERQRRRAEKRVSLNRSALHHLTTATDGAELYGHWRRIRDHFDLLYQVPETVAELRQAILQLAVQGKLVRQDPGDEPASVLLERIEAEKQRLYEAGKIRKPKTLPPVEADEVPFEVPEGWEWVRLESLFYPISPGRNKLKTSEYKERGILPVIDQGQAFIAGYTNQESKRISVPGPVVVFGDHTRAMKYVDFDFVAGADGIKILCPVGVWPRFFYVALLSLPVEDRGYGRHYRSLISNLVALPPYEEQRRIVAKVDQLMTLCDELEAKLTASRTKAEHLAAAVVHHVNAA